MNPFEELLIELGIQMGTSLVPDSNQACLLHFHGSLTCQIELDSNADHLIVGAQLGQLFIGKYREQILLLAMQVNGATDLLRGTLAFSPKNETLVLFERLELASTNGVKLYNFLLIFMEHLRQWKEALQKDEIPAIDELLAGHTFEQKI